MRLSKGINNSLWCADNQIHLILTQALQSVPEWVVIQQNLNKFVGHFSHAKSTNILKKIEYNENQTTLVQHLLAYSYLLAGI